MERVTLQWSLVNWITVFLMASIGLMVVGAIGSAVKAQMGGGTNA